MTNSLYFKRTFGPSPKYKRVIEYQPPDNEFIKIAGPCSVESPGQIKELAKIAKANGATHLRGGVFRAGTYPGDKFGLVSESLMQFHQTAANENGLKNIVEVLDYSRTAMNLFDKYGDCFQIGARQMQNYTLLRHLAKFSKPIFLKRSTGATLDELLGAAEHILSVNRLAEIILIERGSVSYLNHVRWDLSISMIPAVKKITRMPIIVDASHGTGRWDLVKPMTLAGIAAGADGCLVEFHTTPDQSLSDAEQALSIPQFEDLMKSTRKMQALMLALEKDKLCQQ